MRNKRNPSVSKTLVRNAEVPIPPTVLTSKSHKNDISKTHDIRKTVEQNKKSQSSKETPSLCEPSLNSALLIVKEMKHTSEMRSSKITGNGIIKEKVHEINFPYNEHLYHDLVEISMSDIPQSDSISCIKPRSHKYDRSPQLSEFLNPSCIPDIPAVVTQSSSHHVHIPVWDGRRVYLSTEKVKSDCYDEL